MTKLDDIHAQRPDGSIGVFRGPGLLRRSRIGEILVSRRTDRRLVVDRFDSIFDGIVHVHDEVTGEPTHFIWRFTDRLNGLVRHVDETYED